MLIRAIAPSDRAALRAAFERLSEASRYRRFLSPMDRLTDSQLDHLTKLDQRDHVALVAVDPADSGEILGVARFVRSGERVAEPAIAVVDEWQGQGLGTELLQALTTRARDEGVERYEALILAENEPVLRLLSRVGELTLQRAGAEVAAEVSLGPAPAKDRARARHARTRRGRTTRRKRGARG